MINKQFFASVLAFENVLLLLTILTSYAVVVFVHKHHLAKKL